MGFQVRFLGIIEGFEQRAFINRRTCVADIRNMNPYSTNFLNEVRAMLIAATGFTAHTATAPACALIPTQSRHFDLAGHPMFTGIEGETRSTGSNLY